MSEKTKEILDSIERLRIKETELHDGFAAIISFCVAVWGLIKIFF